MIRSLDTFKADKGKEIFRDGVLYAGQTAAIIYRDNTIDGETFAVQLATALAVGKPFGGFIPRDPFKVGVVVSQRNDAEIDKLRDKIGDYWKSVGWTADEIDNAMRQTLIIDCEGKTGEALAKYLRDEQPKEHFDLLIICDLVRCYGDDPETQCGETFAKFLHRDLCGIQSGETPCAILALVGVEDNEHKFNDYIKEPLAAEIPRPETATFRAIYGWARCVFGFFTYDRMYFIVAARRKGELPWRTIHGKPAKDHIMRFVKGCFEEVRIKSVQSEDKRREIEDFYSCADTLEDELDHLKTSKE